jgi:hypothetical protein
MCYHTYMTYTWNNFKTSLLILLQQTSLQKNRFSTSLPNWLNRLIKYFLILVKALNSSRVFKEYENLVLFNSNYLLNFINRSELKVLDIGCGIAGYHKSWLRIYKGNLTLFDSSTFNFTSLRYGYGSKNRYYNSLNLANRYLQEFNESNTQIRIIDSKFKSFSDQKYDLIISFLSWGFHFHLNTYWDEAINSLEIGGLIILDIRKFSTSYEFFINNIYNSNLLVLHEMEINNRVTRFVAKKIA